MLITDQFSWDHLSFESYIEGMCEQIRAFPHHRVAFWAHSTPEVILTFFAIWKVGKIACPLNIRLPSAADSLKQLETALFTPTMPTPLPPTKWTLGNLETLLFTSGSMGMPKIASLSQGNLVYSALGSNQLIPLATTDRWALSLPLFHVGGLGILLRCYLAKSFILLTPDWKQATHLSLVPTQLYRILKEQFPYLKTILLGGAPLPHLQTPWNILPTYGMTEMSSQIVTGNQLHPYAELKIAPDQEIWVRGKVLFQGYLNTPPIKDWFPTGDLGKWENGLFQIIGRKDNMFISGGENIHPEEIEAVIDCRSIVVPISDPEWGQRAAIFLEDPSQLETIQQKLKDHLPKYKIPIKAFPFPEQTGLKPNRKLLAQIALDQYHSSQ